jgi:hypothetical protein
MGQGKSSEAEDPCLEIVSPAHPRGGSDHWEPTERCYHVRLRHLTMETTRRNANYQSEPITILNQP